MTRTLTVRKSTGGSKFSEGWHTATVSTAKYGDWNDTKFLDVCFEGYSDKMNMRVYAKEGKNWEEFAIGNIFRFANAGISDGLEGADGNVTIKNKTIVETKNYTYDDINLKDLIISLSKNLGV